MADVALAGLTKRFGDDRRGRRELSLDIGDGEFFVLLGPTGAGKTTTLRLVAGSGAARCRPRHHRRPRRHRRDRRRRATSPSSSSNIRSIRTSASTTTSPFRCARRSRRLPEAEIAASCARVAALLRIAGKLGNRATQLSGGEMQRVAIGRALVRRPASI